MDHSFQFVGGSGLPSHEVPTPAPPLLPSDTAPHVFASGSLKSFTPPDLSRLDPFQRHALGEFPDIFAPERPKAYGGGYGLSSGYGMWAGALLAGLRANAPGAWSADRLKQANHFVGIAFTAISAMCDGVASATLEVTDMDMEAELRNHVEKSVSHTGRVGAPIPYDHEVYELFRDPNPNDTFKDILYKTVQQLCLTGNNLTWMVPNRLALPSELYSIPTALAYPVPYSQAWPRGAWRLTPLYPYGPFAVLPTPVATAGAVVPADDILHIKMPHPLLTWDGYSPLTAGARQIDIMEMIDDSRWASFDGGINPSMIFTVDPEKAGVNFNQDTLDRFTAMLTQKYANARNFGKGMILPPGVDGKPTSHPPADMAFDGGWEQMRDFILSLWRVPKGVVGITESSSYAALYASLKQFALIGLKPMAERIAEHWTKKLGKKYKKSLIISLPLPALDDPHLLEEQLKTDLQAGVRTKGEWRTMRGLPVFGDERDDEIAGASPAEESALPGLEPPSDKASQVKPKDKPGSAPVSERRDEADNARPSNTDGLHSLPGMGGAKSLTPTRIPDYSFASFPIPEDTATRIRAIGLRIRDDELSPKGRVGLIHLTVAACLVTDDAAAIADAIRGFGPVTVQLGKVNTFPTAVTERPVVISNSTVVAPSIEAHDVLKVDVHSPRLHELHNLIRESFPHAMTYPFAPHITCCYLLPGVGQNFLGSTELEGTELTFTHLHFSDRSGTVTILPLIAARALPFAPVNGHAKMMSGLTSDLVAPPSTGSRSRLLRPDTDTLPLPAPSRPRRSLPFTGRKQAKPRATGDLTTIYPPPDPKPYPDANLTPPPGPAAPPPPSNAQATSGVWWHPPEFEWRLFQAWAAQLPNYYPSIHNLAEYGWARGPRIVATEVYSALTQTPVVSPELKMAILALMAVCEQTSNETSVFVQPEPGADPGPALVTDMKSLPKPTPYLPAVRKKREWDESAIQRGQPDNAGQFGPGGKPKIDKTAPPDAPDKTKPPDADDKTKPRPKPANPDGATKPQTGFKIHTKPADTPRPDTPRTVASPTADALATGKELSSRPLKKRGINSGTTIVQIDSPDGPIAAIFKPSSGEAHTVIDFDTGEERPVRQNISGNYAGREAAASEVADLLGLSDLVPTTTLRGEGSCQKFVANAPNASEVPEDQKFDGPDDLARAAAFDFLTLNLDRHHNNWLLADNQSKLVLIDNGLSFPDSHDNEMWGNSDFLEKAFDDQIPLPPAVREWASQKDAIMTALARNGLSDTEQSLAAARLDLLTTAENFRDLKKNAGINANFFKGMSESEIQAEERR